MQNDMQAADMDDCCGCEDQDERAYYSCVDGDMGLVAR